MGLVVSSARSHDQVPDAREAEVSGKILSPLMIAVLVFNSPLSAGWGHKKEEATAVRMESPDRSMVTVSCKIKGVVRSYICVIDSGATFTVISDRVLKPEGPLVEMTTGNGVIRVHQREVSLTIGDDLELKSKAFIESKMMPENVDVLVGQDVLRQFRSVVFDYDKQQVEFRR
jgi:hypothetical protein